MSSKSKTKLKKYIITGIITIAVLAIMVANGMRQKQTPYESINAKTGDIINYYSFSGNVAAKNRKIVLSDKVMQISEIMVKDGDTVKKGDVLIKTTMGEKIKAAGNGEIAHVSVEKNAQVMGGTKLLEIVDYNNLQINARVDEYDLPAIKAGQKATVNISALKKELSGTVSSISKEGENANGVTFFKTTIDVKNDGSLRIGMSAEVKVQGQKAKGAVLLPMTVVQFDENNMPYVLKKGEKNEAVRTQVATGINDGMSVEIKNGVAAGDTILYKKSGNIGGIDFGGRNDRSSKNNRNSDKNNSTGGNENGGNP